MTPERTGGSSEGEKLHAVDKFELLGRSRAKVTFKDGASIVLKVPRMERKAMSEYEVKAITAMQLAIPLAFPREYNGVDVEWGGVVAQQEGIEELPHHGEANVYEALKWAGAVLLREGVSSSSVAKILMDGTPSIHTAFHLGTIGKERKDFLFELLRREIASKYPGPAAAIERRRNRPAPEW
jgi:hypothetical protein